MRLNRRPIAGAGGPARRRNPPRLLMLLLLVGLSWGLVALAVLLLGGAGSAS